ncbi:MAG: DsbA family protein [Nitrososphaerota archaeon]
MNTHAPSLVIGAAIAIISVLSATIVFGTDFMDFKQVTKTGKDRNGISQQIEDSEKNQSDVYAMSLFTANASPVLGLDNAPITLVEFGDYQCFYCNRFFHTAEPDIVKNYVETGKVKMIFKDFTIIGQDSINAAHAAHCAQEVGKFWEFHDILYNNWTGENNGWASPSNISGFAKQLGLDEEDFKSCMTEARYVSVIKASYSDAQTLGLTGTPGFIIIGPENSITKISGAQPYEVFEEIFNSMLEK